MNNDHIDEEVEKEIEKSFEVATNYELFKQYYTSKNLKVRNELLIRNQPLVTFIVNKYYSSTKIPRETREELFQEGSIGLLSAIDGFDYKKGFKFSTYACVPLTTQILTKHGWKYYFQLNDDDETLGYKNGKTEWTKINKAIVYEEAPLVKFGDSLWSTYCTPNHKWLISEDENVLLKPLTTWPDSKEFNWPKKTKNGYKRPNIKLVTSAPFIGGDSPLTPNEAAILAWVLSDGSLHGWKERKLKQEVIIQSKKKFFNQIKDLLIKEEAFSEPYHKGNDCYGFHVKQSVFKKIWEKSNLSNYKLPELVLSLTPEARKAWFDAWYKAEGTIGTCCATQNYGEKFEALELCAFLEGLHDVGTNEKTKKCGIVRWHTKQRTPRRCIVTQTNETAPVWCPSTELGSWTARDESGNIFLTGNSWWIRQAVNNYLINVNPIIKVPSHVRTIQNKLIKKFNVENQNVTDIAVLSEKDKKELQVSDKMFNSVKSAIKSKQVSSLHKPIYNDGEQITLEDIIPAENNSFDNIIDKQIMIKTVKEALKAMPEKRRLILLLRYDVINKDLKLKRSRSKKHER